MAAASHHPSARRENLVIQELKDEVLVYDLDRDQASCLNPTAALVWRYADGKTSVNEIARRMAVELNSPVDVGVVWYGLEQLGKRNLLQEQVTVPPHYARLTRRDFLVKAGLVGAAVAIPVIISLTAPTAAMAATCFAGCVSSVQCTNPSCSVCNQTSFSCQSS